jgi:hypothetical protein
MKEKESFLKAGLLTSLCHFGNQGTNAFSDGRNRLTINNQGHCFSMDSDYLT